jgi:hypothetical protein
LRYSAIQERDYEGDDSDIPEELEENLISLSETFLRMAQEETAELVSAAKKAGKVTTMSKEVAVMTGHAVANQAYHEKAAAHHKAMAAHHDEQIATHQAIHEHFKKAAEDGGEMAYDHVMHAIGAKAHADHHAIKSAHHKAMNEMHDKMGASCGELADAFADTPEKAQKVRDLQNVARAALPFVAKAAVAIPSLGQVDKSQYLPRDAEDVQAEQIFRFLQ